MEKTSGVFEVDMFSADIDDVNHPRVMRLKELLEDVGDEYNCCLTSFDIDKGTVIFSFDNDDLTTEILRILKNDNRD